MNTNVSTATDITGTDECVIIGWNAIIPWQNPRNLISLDTMTVVKGVITAIIFPLLYFIGVPANIVNMVVFHKQGLKERINLCLFLLALVDLLYITVVLIFNADGFDGNFTKIGRGTINRYIMNNNVVGLSGLVYASRLLSTVISVERCVCVLFPLRAQRCVPTKVLGVAVVMAVCVVAFMRFVVTAKYRVTCFHEMRTGRRSWQITANEYFFQNREMLTVLDGAFYGFCLSVGCCVLVLLTTVITAVRLLQTIRWRQRQSCCLSDKEIGVTKMLIWFSMEFVVLSIPSMLVRIVPMFEPRLSARGEYSNAFTILVNIGYLGSYMSSCVNFFVYYFTGSRYRETLHRLLGRKSSSQHSQRQHYASRAEKVSEMK